MSLCLALLGNWFYQWSDARRRRKTIPSHGHQGECWIYHNFIPELVFFV